MVTDPSASKWVYISLYDTRTCAISSAGVPACWGLNDNGAAGSPVNLNVAQKSPLVPQTNVTYTSLTMGTTATCATPGVPAQRTVLAPPAPPAIPYSICWVRGPLKSSLGESQRQGSNQGSLACILSSVRR